MKGAGGKWHGCKVSRLCVICGAKHKCAYSDDGVWSKCRYNLSEPGALLGSDQIGDYALYAHDGGRGRDPAHRPQRPEPVEPPRADAAFCDEVYSFVLGLLKLLPHHDQNLIGRGLSHAQIERGLFRSLPRGQRKAVCLAVREKFGDRALEVPGFYKNEQGRLMLGGDEGLVVPVRDVHGHVVALKPRREVVDDDGPKYRIISSSSHGGPSPGSPVHVPFFEGSRDRVRVTEGELKAEVLTALTGVLTISIPGATSLGGVLDALTVLGAKTVVAAWDADKAERRIDTETGKLKTNWVARGFERGCHLFADAGLALEVEDWPFERGKGLDDVWQAGRSGEVTTLAGQDAWKCVAATLRAAGGEPDAATCARAGEPPPAPAPPAPPVGRHPGPGGGPDRVREADEADDAREPPAGAARPRRDEGGGRPAPFVRGDTREFAETMLREKREDSPEPIVFADGAFLRYKTALGVWVELDEIDLYNHVTSYGGTHGRFIENGVDKNGEPRFKPVMISKTLAEGVIEVASKMAAKKHFFRDAPAGCAFKNGFVTVSSKGKIDLRPHSPLNRARHPLNFDYDEAAEYDRWEDFFGEVFLSDPTAADPTQPDDPRLAEKVAAVAEVDKLRAAVEEAIGAALMGLAPRYAKAIVLYGPHGSNGKSTLLGALRSLFAPEAIASVPPQRWVDKFSVFSLAGKQINLVGELPARDVQDSSTFKAVITGDDVYAEQKGKDGLRFQPRAAHFFSANGLPGTSDTSEGFWRRFLVIPWLRSFTGAAVRYDMQAYLEVQLQGLAVRCVQGAARLVHNHGYTIGDASQRALLEWQLEADQVRRFVEEWMVTAAQVKDLCAKIGDKFVAPFLSNDEIYAHYTEWSKVTGHGTMSASSLRSRLKQLGHESRTNGARGFGLELNAIQKHGPSLDQQIADAERRLAALHQQKSQQAQQILLRDPSN